VQTDEQKLKSDKERQDIAAKKLANVANWIKKYDSISKEKI
jgi:hypothetical protein